MTQTLDLQDFSETSPLAVEPSAAAQPGVLLWLKKLRGGLLFAIGYLLSPLCWWNDLIFNLPVAYGFGYLVSRFQADALIPGAIAGYWLSNVVGILMMQAGVIDVFQNADKPRNPRKELISGVVTSTVYTLLIVVLVKFNVLQLPEMIAEDGSLNLSPLLNWFGQNS